MAEIYLARARGIEGFEKTVVIKRILPQLATNQEFVRMFLDEARIAATFHHPNIVQVYDIGSVGGNYFFSMEFLHGEDVRAILKKVTSTGKRLPLQNALSIGVGICAGLHYAHDKNGFDGTPLGIVHRDVSPQNVFVTYDGCVKVVDFGIAKASNRLSQTRYGTLKGKFSYMSPEQCRSEPLDRRSDVFSIGIMLYELTTCRKLFKGSEFEVLKTIVETDAIPPSFHDPEYPRELERIVLQALARNRANRYPTAQELQLDLEEFAREHKLSVSAISVTRFMQGLFHEKLAAWQAAQRAGKSLVNHIAESLGEPSRVLPVKWAGSGIDPFAGTHGAASALTPVVAVPPGPAGPLGKLASSSLTRDFFEDDEFPSIEMVEPRRGQRVLLAIGAVCLIAVFMAAVWPRHPRAKAEPAAAKSVPPDAAPPPSPSEAPSVPAVEPPSPRPAVAATRGSQDHSHRAAPAAGAKTRAPTGKKPKKFDPDAPLPF